MKQALFDSPAMVALKQSLDIASLKQRITAHNIANVETEGYVPRQVEFRQELQKAMAVPPVPITRTAPGHMFPNLAADPALPVARVVERPGAGIEEFLVDLVENSFQYQASAKLLAGEYGRLHESIRGRST